LILGNGGILVEAVNFRVWIERKRVDIIHITFVLGMLRGVIKAGRGEFIAVVCVYVLVEKIGENNSQQSPVFAVRYSSAVVTFTY
jgi:hypothetical protein